MDAIEKGQLTGEQALEHWYYQAKFEMLKSTLLSKIANVADLELADFGSGLGLFLTLLERNQLLSPQQMVGIDTAYREPVQSMEGSVPILPDWPKGKKFDLMLMMDVLEHIPDDAGALRFAVEQVKPGGWIFITVPAFPWLWSSHDRALKHYRRYTVDSLQALVQKDPQLEIERLHYFYASIFIPAVLIRLRHRNSKQISSELKPLPSILNRFLCVISKLESKWARWNRLAGLSVVALVRKKSE